MCWPSSINREPKLQDSQPKNGGGVGLEGYSGIQLSCSQINQLHFGLKNYSNLTNMGLEDPVDS